MVEIINPYYKFGYVKNKRNLLTREFEGWISWLTKTSLRSQIDDLVSTLLVVSIERTQESTCCLKQLSSFYERFKTCEGHSQSLVYTSRTQYLLMFYGITRLVCPQTCQTRYPRKTVLWLRMGSEPESHPVRFLMTATYLAHPSTFVFLELGVKVDPEVLHFRSDGVLYVSIYRRTTHPNLSLST